MNGLDLFSGIGGLTKALEGYVQPVAYCDIEPYSRAVLLSRMATGDIPVAPIWDNVTSLTGATLPNIDIIYGGFPCQDISSAGRQIGLEGKRSGLFFQILRLAQETECEWIFLENVSNIRIKGLGRVLKELAGIGYDCRWGILPASDVGAPHRRLRWFLLAHSRSRGQEDPMFTGNETTERGRVVLPSRGDFLWQSASSDEYGRLIEPTICRVAHGVPARVDRLRALGNAVVPAQAREAFERLIGIK